MRTFYVSWELGYYMQTRSFSGVVKRTQEKIRTLRVFFLGPALTLPLLMLPWVLRDRRVRFLLLTGGVMISALAVQVWTSPHYAAPATALLYVLLVQAMRHLRLWRWRRRPVPGAGHPAHLPSRDWCARFGQALTVASDPALARLLLPDRTRQRIARQPP